MSGCDAIVAKENKLEYYRGTENSSDRHIHPKETQSTCSRGWRICYSLEVLRRDQRPGGHCTLAGGCNPPVGHGCEQGHQTWVFPRKQQPCRMLVRALSWAVDDSLQTAPASTAAQPGGCQEHFRMSVGRKTSYPKRSNVHVVHGEKQANKPVQYINRNKFRLETRREKSQSCL